MADDQKVWVATVAPTDLYSDERDEIIGVFSSEEAALEAARGFGQLTACASEFRLDEVPQRRLEERG